MTFRITWPDVEVIDHDGPWHTAIAAAEHLYLTGSTDYDDDDPQPALSWRLDWHDGQRNRLCLFAEDQRGKSRFTGIDVEEVTS